MERDHTYSVCNHNNKKVLSGRQVIFNKILPECQGKSREKFRVF